MTDTPSALAPLDVITADREDGQPPVCRWGDGPCESPRRCTDAGRCLRGDFHHDHKAMVMMDDPEAVAGAGPRRPQRDRWLGAVFGCLISIIILLASIWLGTVWLAAWKILWG